MAASASLGDSADAVAEAAPVILVTTHWGCGGVFAVVGRGGGVWHPLRRRHMESYNAMTLVAVIGSRGRRELLPLPLRGGGGTHGGTRREHTDRRRAP